MISLKVHEIPTLENPTIIAALPDMGNVAGLGLEFIIKKLKAKVFAEIFAYWPPSVSYEAGQLAK